MKKLCILVLSLIVTAPVWAQTKTVTNADLEKYRQQRLESERKLREEYARQGITVEQIERQNAAERAALDKLSDELRYRRIQEEIARANAASAARTGAQPNYIVTPDGYTGGFVYSYGGYPFYNFAPFGFTRGNRVLRQVRNLPPNVRTVQEYGLMYPNWRPAFTQPRGNVRFGGGIRFGGTRGGRNR